VMQDLLSRGTERVVLTSRSLDAGMQAKRSLPSSAQARVDVMQLDVASEDSRKAFVEDFEKRFERLDLLINNAGVYINEWSPAKFEEHMQVNAVGPLDLTQRLVERYSPVVRQDPSAGAQDARRHLRVVNVSSGYGQLSAVSPKYKGIIQQCQAVAELGQDVKFDPDDSQRGEYVGAYKVSKAALNRGTQLQASSFAPLLASVAVVCPGWVRTRMGGPTASRSVEEGAASVVATALAADPAAVSGIFFRDGKEMDF